MAASGGFASADGWVRLRRAGAHPVSTALVALLACACEKGTTSTPDAGAVEESDLGVFQRPERAFRDALPAPVDASVADAAPDPDTGIFDFGVHPAPSRAARIGEGSYSTPLAVTASARGEIYFSALNAEQEATLYQLDARGRLSVIHSGAPLVLPTGLAVDAEGTRLFAADLGAGLLGAVYEIGISNPAPIRVVYEGGIDLSEPAALAYDPTTRVLYIAGTSLNTDRGGIWTLGPGDPQPVAVVLDPLVVLGDPSGLAVAPSDGTLYIYDTLSPSSQRGRIWRIADNGATSVADNLRAGFPSGIALSGDEAFLLVATSTPTRAGGDVVLSIELASRNRRALTLGTRLVEARGIVQIPSTLRWVVIDGFGGAAGAGALYRLD